MRKQCSSCYGPHPKRFCRSERCGFESFVIGYSRKYKHVPAELYGKHSNLVENSKNEVPLSQPCETTVQAQPKTDAQSWTEVGHHSKPKSPSTAQTKSNLLSQPRSQSRPQPNGRADPEPVQSHAKFPINSNVNPKLRVVLTRGPNGDWAPNARSTQVKTSSASAPVTSATVVSNVTSFLSGIRATFRQDNVNVVSQQVKPSQPNQVSQNGEHN